MTEQQVQGGTVKQDTGEHILGSGFKDEVSTAFSSSFTHYTHTGALQTNKNYEDNGITISKRPAEDAYDEEDYGQILATSKEVYNYLESLKDVSVIQQWENTVSLHRSKLSQDTFRRQRNVIDYPKHFFKKKNGLWFKTVKKTLSAADAELLDTRTSENLKNPVTVIMWKYNVQNDIFNKVYEETGLIGNDANLFQNEDFKKAKALGTRTNQELIKEYEKILKLEKAFYENEKLLDAKELAQLKVDEAEYVAAEAAKGNVVSRAAGSLAVAGAGALAALGLGPVAPLTAASAVPAAAYSAAGVGAAAAAAGGTSAAAAAPFSLVAAVAAAPLSAAAAAGAAAAAVGGVGLSQIQQSSANSQLASARTELKEAERAAEASKVNLQEASNRNAKTLIENLQTSRSGRLQANTRHQLLINTLAERRRESVARNVARREIFGNVAQQYRTIHQGRSRTSFPKRTPKPKHTSKCKVYQSRSRKTGHCRNKSRKSPCKSGKTRKGTGRCHKPKV